MLQGGLAATALLRDTYSCLCLLRFCISQKKFTILI